MIDLGTLGGTWVYTNGINDSGQIVGQGGTVGDAATHAFLHSDSIMYDLNTLIDPSSGWTLWDARDINNAGQIVGTGVNSSGQDHALLLTPVPEPPTIILLGMCAISLLAYSWRKRK
jgi:probable HAF family extracellular repeat protein